MSSDLPSRVSRALHPVEQVSTLLRVIIASTFGASNSLVFRCLCGWSYATQQDNQRDNQNPEDSQSFFHRLHSFL
jgi:hypothetical protein